MTTKPQVSDIFKKRIKTHKKAVNESGIDRFFIS